ncbi:cx9C motif-containing protein 4-like [Babylonia areolata]|uniref:cx9C motif-containing protein 4-like n=1 Tax=Babylonia areolata TaxID=304850 RepID=UPI003FD32CDB
MPQKPKADPCQKQACEIQKCLQAHKYQESQCEDVINAMLQCCAKFQDLESVCCAGFLKSRRMAKIL